MRLVLPLIAFSSLTSLACGAPHLHNANASIDAGTGGAYAHAVDAGSTSGDDVDAGSASDAGAAIDGGAVVDAGNVVPADAGVAPVDAGTLTATSCFASIHSQTGVAPDYDQFGPVINSNCVGTNHQDITGIERVVFLGDSVTVGTPPSESSQFYRSLLADQLAAQFNLEPPSALWKTANPLQGTASIVSSGDFWSCAKWGARTDDLASDNHQIDDCFPAAERNKKALVIMTAGNNDISAITKDGVNMPADQAQAQVADFVQRLRDAITYMKDPAQFPGGVDVIFTNNYEFTDGTGDVSSCPAASVAGFGAPWPDPAALASLVVWSEEQYMSIAVDTQSDMLFLEETFCGHGYHNDDPNNGCYRGPNTERWFDLSCIHPNPTGHQQIADMIMELVSE